jgi:hypothetical protein
MPCLFLFMPIGATVILETAMHGGEKDCENGRLISNWLECLSAFAHFVAPNSLFGFGTWSAKLLTCPSPSFPVR